MADEKSRVASRFGNFLQWIVKYRKISTSVGVGIGVLTGFIIGVLVDNIVLWTIVGFLVFGLGGVGVGLKKGNGS